MSTINKVMLVLVGVAVSAVIIMGLVQMVATSAQTTPELEPVQQEQDWEKIAQSAYAVLAMRRDDIDLLVEAYKRHPELIHYGEDNDAESWLWQAAKLGRNDAVSFLVANGAKVSDSEGHSSALCVAARNGHRQVISTLVRAGARDPEALLVAASFNRADVIYMLAQRGFDVNAKSEDMLGRTAMHRAANSGAKDAIQALIDGGATINARDSQGRTPLELAEYSGHLEVVKLLRQHGAQRGGN